MGAVSQTANQDINQTSGILSIVMERADAVRSVSSVLWKYANGVEGEGNYKSVFNIMADSGVDAIDGVVLSDSWDAKTSSVIDILRDFITNVTENKGVSKTVSLSMPARWNGNRNALVSDVKRYVIDGMLADWLDATAPSQAALYVNQLQRDEKSIIDNIYSKKAPI